MSMVKHKRGTLYTLDVQQEAELMALVNKSDEDIDYSDIPASGSEAWSDAKRGNFLPAPGIHAQ
ncbi:antitoxin [Escherichia coli]